jgi:hypothetical protein
LHNMTLAGNSTSAGAGYIQISSGTATLAGGNNITLSQNGNAVTVSAANQTVQTQSLIAGIYDGANSISTGTVRFSNSNGVSFGINGQTITASHNGITSQTNQNVSLYALGNTTQNSSTLLNASNLSFNGLGEVTMGFSNGSIQVSAPTQTVQTQSRFNLTLAGNSTSAGAGYAQVSSGTMTLAGGNNITLSQNGNAVTVSAFNQSNQTVGLYALSNTTQSTTATVDARSMSFAGAGIASVGATNGSVVISVPSGGGAGFTAGMSNIGNTSGTTGMATNELVLAGGNNITLSQSTGAGGNTVTISAANGGGGATGSYFDNMFQQNSVQGITFTSVSTGMFGRVLLQPLSPGNELFPYDMTASTMLLNFSNSGSSAISGAFTSSFYIGIYTRVNSTQLSLLNSASTSYGLAAATNNSASFLGARWLSFHSSLFSSEPAMRAGTRYFFGLLARSSSNSYASHSLAGMHLGASIQRSGYMATAGSSHTSFNAWHPFMGVHSLTTHTALPVSVANSDINKASVYANFIPQVIFDAGLGAIN